MKKIALVLLSVALVAFPAFANGTTEAAAQPAVLSLGTASLGGNFFTMGAAMAAAVMDKTDLQVTAQATGGSAYNAGAVDSGELSIGMAQASTIASAVAGTDSFDKAPTTHIRTMFNYSATPLHIVVRKNKNAKTFSDLKGLKIECLVIGDGVETTTRKLLPAMGISLDDVTLEYSGNRTQASSRLKTGQVDAILDATGLGAAWMADVLKTGDFVMIELSDAEIEKICSTFTEMSPMTIPAGTYAGFDKDIKTVGNWTTVFCNENLSEDSVYAFVKAIFESKASLVKAHAFFKDLAPENIVGSVIAPLHPGAEKYFKEAGVI